MARHGYAVTGCTLDGDRRPLEAAALVVQEDLCILVRGDDGTWRLDAGVERWMAPTLSWRDASG